MRWTIFSKCIYSADTANGKFEIRERAIGLVTQRDILGFMTSFQ